MDFKREVRTKNLADDFLKTHDTDVDKFVFFLFKP